MPSNVIFLFLLFLALTNLAVMPSILSSLTSSSAFAEFDDRILPAWNQGPTKERIVNFVKNVTNPESPNYLPGEERIAAFDNDGTLWSEKPTYFEGFFILDRLETLYKTNPVIQQQVQEKPEFRQLLEKNFTNLHLSEKDILDLALATHSNITQKGLIQVEDCVNYHILSSYSISCLIQPSKTIKPSYGQMSRI
jgi:uncharacterized membrane protein